MKALYSNIMLRQLFAQTRDAEPPAADNRELIEKMDRLNRTLEELNRTLNNKTL